MTWKPHHIKYGGSDVCSDGSFSLRAMQTALCRGWRLQTRCQHGVCVCVYDWGCQTGLQLNRTDVQHSNWNNYKPISPLGFFLSPTITLSQTGIQVPPVGLGFCISFPHATWNIVPILNQCVTSALTLKMLFRENMFNWSQIILTGTGETVHSCQRTVWSMKQSWSFLFGSKECQRQYSHHINY